MSERAASSEITRGSPRTSLCRARGRDPKRISWPAGLLARRSCPAMSFLDLFFFTNSFGPFWAHWIRFHLWIPLPDDSGRLLHGLERPSTHPKRYLVDAIRALDPLICTVGRLHAPITVHENLPFNCPEDAIVAERHEYSVIFRFVGCLILVHVDACCARKATLSSGCTGLIVSTS